MLIDFFLALKSAGLPVSVKEYLTLCEAMQKGVAYGNVDDFYYLSRTCLVKDEANFDRFDRAFGQYFKGMENLDAALTKLFEQEIPAEWLQKLAEKLLTDEEKAQIKSLGGWDKLMETLRERLAAQKDRHQRGNKWIGTAGTSPFGAYGYNPEGIRIGQDKSRHKSAVKVWDQREYRDYDSQVELGIRNIQMALRRLRKFARTGAAAELDLDNTIKATANNAGYLDIKLVPERHNRVKVLLFFDVGGSMDEYIHRCEELFSAAKTEFKHLEYFYFHNFVYESVWRNNRLRQTEKFSTWDVIHRYGNDYKLIIVGDATMSPYEILQPGGSVEHWNEETGSTWLERLTSTYRHAVWINPTPEAHWPWTQSVLLTRQLMEDRMYPMTVDGLDRAMRALI
ncbi:von Willebrand factor A [Betaproteobacteria bacterium UKL13-2]|nr:von Willebrand factor A [Betaproteobacteria bacterium UKL13-2]HCG53744.1 VWA domain-containing protein [Betaproteobacteria bacterium]